MFVVGKKTTVEDVSVEIEPISVILQLIKDHTPKGLAFLGRNGHWYRADGYDYHNRNDIFAKDRSATPEEKELFDALDVVLGALKK